MALGFEGSAGQLQEDDKEEIETKPATEESTSCDNEEEVSE